MTRRATCHPDRPYLARGLCAPCYKSRRRSALRAAARQNIPCVICGRPFSPERVRAMYCCEICRRVGIKRRQADRRGTRPEDEEIYATRDRDFAAEIARTARERGCRRIKPNAPGMRVGAPGYYCAWHRGGGLYLVRVRWPDSEGELEAAAGTDS